jgi:hypothetical protein
MKRCDNCHRAIFFQAESNWCGCERVLVWTPSLGETEEDAESCFTKDTEELAESIARASYNQDPSDPNKFSRTVCVKGPQGNIQTFAIRAEVSVDFYATEITG